MTSKKLLVFLALCVIWGSTWFASTVVAGQIPPMRAGAIRFLLGAIILLPVSVVRRPTFPRGRALAANTILSATMIAFPLALVVWVLSRTSPGIIAILFAFTPLIAGFFGNSIRFASMPQSAMYASILGVAGVVLLFSSALSISLDQAVAIAVVFLAVTSAAVSSVYAKRELDQVDPIISAVLQLSGAAILLFVLSAIFEQGQPSTWSPAVVTAQISLGFIASAVAYPIYFWLLKGMEPWQMGTVQWFEPLIAILEGALLYREPLSWRMLGGATILLVCFMRVIAAQLEDDDSVTLQITD